MGLSTIAATIGGVLKNILVGSDANGNIAPAHVPVSSTGVELLTDGAGRQQLYWGAGIATNQVTIDTTAGGKPIVPARPGRRSVLIINEGTTLVRLGASGLTMTSGIPLPGLQYASVVIEGGAAVYGLVASGTQNVSYMESF